MERWYASDSKVRSLSQRTQQAAVCRAKSMRAGDRELPPLPLVLLPSWHAILFHLYPCRNQPSSLVCPPLAAFPPLFLSFVRILLRISGYTNAVGHAHPRFKSTTTIPGCVTVPVPFPISRFPFLLSSFTFTKTLLTPHGLISSTIFIKVFTLNELDVSLHLYCLS